MTLSRDQVGIGLIILGIAVGVTLSGLLGFLLVICGLLLLVLPRV